MRRTVLTINPLLAIAALLSRCAPAPPDSAGIPAGDGASIIEYRLADDEAHDGWQPSELNGQVIYIAPEPLLTDDDFEAVRPEPGRGRLVLDLHLRPVAMDRLVATISDAVGQRIALFLNSELRDAPRIMSPISGSDRNLQVSVAITGMEAERLARQIRRRWPALP